MAKRMSFKVSILTPWTLLPSKLSPTECTDNPANKFAELLCYRTRVDLLRFAFWPRARGEAYLCSSFDAFEERFLHYSEYAVIVLSGYHVSCLDYIYPRLLVFFTMRPSWSARFLIVFLGEPEGRFRFDTRMLTHEPITFTGTAEDHWSSDEESWTKLFNILKDEYCPQRPEDIRYRQQSFNSGAWMSVTDLRGQHLAVKFTQRPPQSYTNPPSWNDLRDCGSSQLAQKTANHKLRGCSSPSARARSRVPSLKRRRVDSENLYDPYSDDEDYRSSSLPRFPITCVSPRSGTARSSPIPRVNAELSPYMKRHSALRFSADPMKIEENEEDIPFEQCNSNISYKVPQLPSRVGPPLVDWCPVREEKRVVISPLGETDVILTVEHSSSEDHRISPSSTLSLNEKLPSSSSQKTEIPKHENSVSISTDYLTSGTQFVKNAIENRTQLQHENKASQTLLADEPSGIGSMMLDSSSIGSEKDEGEGCISLQGTESATKIYYNTQSSIFIDRSTSIILSSSDSLLKGVPETPPSSPIDFGSSVPCTTAVRRCQFRETSAKQDAPTSNIPKAKYSTGSLEKRNNNEEKYIFYPNAELAHEPTAHQNLLKIDSGLESESIGYLNEEQQHIVDSNGEETSATSICCNSSTWEYTHDDETGNVVKDTTPSESGSTMPTLFVPVDKTGQESIGVPALGIDKTELQENSVQTLSEPDEIHYDGDDNGVMTSVTLSSTARDGETAKTNELSPKLSTPQYRVQAQKTPFEQTNIILTRSEAPKQDENELISMFLKATASYESLGEESGHLIKVSSGSMNLVGRSPPLNVISSDRVEQTSSTSEIGLHPDRHCSVSKTEEKDNGVELVSVFLTAKALGNRSSSEIVPITPTPSTTQRMIENECVSSPNATSDNSISLSKRFGNLNNMNELELIENGRESERFSDAVTSKKVEKLSPVGDRSSARGPGVLMDLAEDEQPLNMESSVRLKESSATCDLPKVLRGHLGSRSNLESEKSFEVDSSLVSLQPSETEAVPIALLDSSEHKPPLNTNLAIDDQQINDVSKEQEKQMSPSNDSDNEAPGIKGKGGLSSLSVNDDLILSADRTIDPSSVGPGDLVGQNKDQNTEVSVRLHQTSVPEESKSSVDEHENPEYRDLIKTDRNEFPLKPTELKDDKFAANTSVAPVSTVTDVDDQDVINRTGVSNNLEQTKPTLVRVKGSECNENDQIISEFRGHTERESISMFLKPIRSENGVADENVFIAADALAPVDLVKWEQPPNITCSMPLNETNEGSKQPANVACPDSKPESSDYGDNIEVVSSSMSRSTAEHENETVENGREAFGKSDPVASCKQTNDAKTSIDQTNSQVALEIGSHVGEQQDPEYGHKIGAEASSLFVLPTGSDNLAHVVNGSISPGCIDADKLVILKPILDTQMSLHSDHSDPRNFSDHSEHPTNGPSGGIKISSMILTRKPEENRVPSENESFSSAALPELIEPKLAQNTKEKMDAEFETPEDPKHPMDESKTRENWGHMKVDSTLGVLKQNAGVDIFAIQQVYTDSNSFIPVNVVEGSMEEVASSIDQLQLKSCGINEGEHGATSLHSLDPLKFIGNEPSLKGNSRLSFKQNDYEAQKQQYSKDNNGEQEALPFDSGIEVDPILRTRNKLVSSEPLLDKPGSEAELYGLETADKLSNTPWQDQNIVHLGSLGISDNHQVSHSKRRQDGDALYYTDSDRERLVAEPVPSNAVRVDIWDSQTTETERITPINLVMTGNIEPNDETLENGGAPNDPTYNSGEPYLTRSPQEESNNVCSGMNEQSRECEEELRSEHSTEVYDRTILPYHPRAWNLMGLSSLIDFVLGYIPRHAHWFYASTFQSREELMNVMAGQTIRLNIQEGLRNPVYVTLVFLGITTVSPHISRLPQLMAQLVDTAEVYLFLPTFWINRPILSHMNLITHRVRLALPWTDSTTITSFSNYPWHMASPTDQA